MISDGVGDGTDDAYFNLKSLYEQDLERKIQQPACLHSGSAGPGECGTRQRDAPRREPDTFDPKKLAPLQSRTKTLTNSTQSGPPGGRPGLAAQGGPGSAPVSLDAQPRVDDGREDAKRKRRKTPSPRRTSMVQIKGLTPKQVRASIVVPTSYYRAIWMEKNKPADGSQPTEPTDADLQAIELVEKKNIAAAVAAAAAPWRTTTAIR